MTAQFVIGTFGRTDSTEISDADVVKCTRYFRPVKIERELWSTAFRVHAFTSGTIGRVSSYEKQKNRPAKKSAPVVWIDNSINKFNCRDLSGYMNTIDVYGRR